MKHLEIHSINKTYNVIQHYLYFNKSAVCRMYVIHEINTLNVLKM